MKYIIYVVNWGLESVAPCPLKLSATVAFLNISVLCDRGGYQYALMISHSKPNYLCF
jgi:hypothetical protein